MDLASLQSLPDAIGVGLGMGTSLGAGFFIFKWLAEWLTGRMDKKQARLDKIQDDIITGLLKDVERLKSEGGEMRGEIRALREQLNECETRHVEAERKVAKLEATIDAAGHARQPAQQIIAAAKFGGEA